MRENTTETIDAPTINHESERTETERDPDGTARKNRRDQNRTDLSLTHFFCLLSRLQVWAGGAGAPPNGGPEARYRASSPGRQQQPAGGRLCGRPPASQHHAVSGGGGEATLTASCCEAGLGGGRDA